jgi:hypothetical protein
MRSRWPSWSLWHGLAGRGYRGTSAELSREAGLVCAELGKLIRQSENILGDPTERILRLADLSFVVLD